METKMKDISMRAQLAAWWLLNRAKTVAQKELSRLEAAEAAVLGKIREQKLEEIEKRDEVKPVRNEES